MNKLSNLIVLVTRPEAAGEALCAIINNEGGKAIHFPTITFAPPKNQQAFIDTINLLSNFNTLIFISPQAVIASKDAIKTKWPTLKQFPAIAAVGEGTKKVLLEIGLPVNYVPEGQWSSEGLLALPALQAVTGQRILIIRGEGGREMLADTLSARGAKVEHLLAYERVIPALPTDDVLALMKNHKIHAIVCTSFTGVQNLKTMLSAEGWPYLQSIPLIVVSHRISKLAQEIGFNKIQLAANASHDAILQTLLQNFSKR